MRLTLTAAAVSTLVACASSAADQAAQAAALIAALETKVPLPDASRPLANYERYYAVSRDRIEAVYLSPPRGSGRVHLVDRRELPKAKAGGCSAVNLVFDRSSNRFDRILCAEVRLTGAEPRLRPVGGTGSRGERG